MNWDVSTIFYIEPDDGYWPELYTHKHGTRLYAASCEHYFGNERTFIPPMEFEIPSCWMAL